MELKQTTQAEDIKQVIQSLQGSYDLCNLAVQTLSGLRIKLTVDFSPGCTECGQYADFIKDCRDKLLITQIKNMVVFMDCITRLQYVINHDNNTTNSEAIKQEKAYMAPKNNN